jgi:hypothetical protein
MTWSLPCPHFEYYLNNFLEGLRYPHGKYEEPSVKVIALRAKICTLGLQKRWNPASWTGDVRQFSSDQTLTVSMRIMRSALSKRYRDFFINRNQILIFPSPPPLATQTAYNGMREGGGVHSQQNRFSTLSSSCGSATITFLVLFLVKVVRREGPVLVTFHTSPYVSMPVGHLTTLL